MLVAVVQRVDVGLADGQRVTELTGEVDGAGNFLAQHGRLDGVSRGGADGEHAVALHEHGLRAMQGERLDDSAADGVIADQRERPDGDLPAELVGHHGEHAWDRFAASSPGRGVGRVGMGLPADPGQVLVHVGVCGGVGGGRTVPIDEVGIEIGDHHGIRGQLVVADPGRLDHQQVLAWNAGRDVTGGPDHEPVPGQLGVKFGNLLPQPGDDVVDVCGDAHVAAPQRSIGWRSIGREPPVAAHGAGA